MMNTHDLDFETIRPIDLKNGALTPGSKATPFSTFLWAVVSEDIAATEAQITDDFEWGLMPYNKVLLPASAWRQAGEASSVPSER